MSNFCDGARLFRVAPYAALARLFRVAPYAALARLFRVAPYAALARLFRVAPYAARARYVLALRCEHTRAFGIILRDEDRG